MLFANHLNCVCVCLVLDCLLYASRFDGDENDNMYKVYCAMGRGARKTYGGNNSRAHLVRAVLR